MTVATSRISTMESLGRLVKSRKTGYTQDARLRWSYLDKKNRTILAGKEGDCSALAAGIAWAAGYDVDISGTCWTGNLDVLMKKAGWTVIKFASLSQVKAGDMVLKKGAHVVNALTKTEWLSAQANEKGKKLGGKPGDQTGREIVIRSPYLRPGGWDYILRPPAETKPDPVDPPKPPVVKPTFADFRFGQANMLAQRFAKPSDKAPKDTAPDDGEALKTFLGCSVYALCETPEPNRYAIRDVLGPEFKVYELNYLCVMWDSSKWQHSKDVKRVTFDNRNIHGAIKVRLTHKVTGLVMDVISVHVRPEVAILSADKVAGKQRDIRHAAALRDPKVATIIAGDFNTSTVDAVLLPMGWKRGTPKQDSLDKEGEQPFDGVFYFPGKGETSAMSTRAASLKNPGNVSDHKWWVWNGRLGTKPSPSTL